jgi:ubiquinone/menaquinone biosynthesis C-methylase UbiE
VNKRSTDPTRIAGIYRRRAAEYDASGIAGLESWRREAVDALGLPRLVVDVGCGAGLNFPSAGCGPGRQGVDDDLTVMQSQARNRLPKPRWRNVELVQVDAAHYTFPPWSMGLSPFALTFVPNLSASSRTAAGPLPRAAGGSCWIWPGLRGCRSG